MLSRTTIVSLILVSLLGAQNAAALLRHRAETAYRLLWEFHPVDATATGCHEYDDRLGDYSATNISATAAKLRTLLNEVKAIDTTLLDLDNQIDRTLLIANLEMELFRLEQLRSWSNDPKFYADECIYGCYYLLLRDFAPLSDRAANLCERLKEIPRVLNQARQNIKSPPRLYAQAAIDLLCTGKEFLRTTVSQLAARFPHLAQALMYSGELAIEEFDRYQRELSAMLPGLKDSFAMGRANYDYLLQHEYLLPFDSDSLLRLGENIFAQSDSLIRLLNAHKAAYDQAHPMPQEPVLMPPAGFSKSEIIAYQQAEIESMRLWVERQGIATVPEYVGELRMTETPAFLRSIIPGAAMEPPAPLDEVTISYYYQPPFPEPLDSATKVRWYNLAHYRRWKGGIVHEGYPGHHLQLSIANHHPSLIRRLQGNTCLIEGWALYCEQLVAEQGLYRYWQRNDTLLPLAWLGGVKFRAARVILDVKLHTGQMSYDEACRFMYERFGGDTAFLKSEVRRYCLSPGQPMSYLVGKLQIMALRDEYQRRTGATLREFHDHLIAEGSIPVCLIRRKLIGD